MDNSNSSCCLTGRLEKHHCRKHVLEKRYKITSVVLLGGYLDEEKC